MSKQLPLPYNGKHHVGRSSENNDDDDSSSTPLDGPSKGDSTASRNENSREINEIYRLVQNKTRVLFVWRIFFLITLVISMAVVSIQIYRLATSEYADDDEELVCVLFLCF